MTDKELNITVEAEKVFNKSKASNQSYNLGLFEGFILGAKSDAAKEFWREYFKNENINIIESIADMG